MGGLGLRSTELHSPAAFIASQVGCRDLCIKLDPHYTWDPTQQFDISRSLEAFNSRVEPSKQIPVIGNTHFRQQQLSQAIDDNSLGIIRSSRQNDTHFRANLNLITASGTGAWLHAVSSRAIGTHVDPLLYRTMVQRRPRVPLFESAFHCPLCDTVIDRFGDHSLTCACGGDRTKRHNLLRNEVFYFCKSAGLNPELERPGLLQPRPLAGAVQENGSERDSTGQ